MRKAAIFNYNSIFAGDIVKAIHMYSLLRRRKAFSIDMYRAEKYLSESQIGSADIIIHSGGDGRPVKEDAANTPKLYICYSHQWKAKMEGARVIRLKAHIEGIRPIDILEDDDVLGRRGKMSIMEYHELAVVSPPRSAKVVATSKVRDLNGKEIEIIEALRYPSGSVSVQGHPEEGRAFHIFYNFFKKLYP